MIICGVNKSSSDCFDWNFIYSLVVIRSELSYLYLFQDVAVHVLIWTGHRIINFFSSADSIWILSRTPKLEGDAKTAVDTFFKNNPKIDQSKLVHTDFSEEACKYSGTSVVSERPKEDWIMNIWESVVITAIEEEFDVVIA